VKRVQVEGFHPGSDAISNFEIALEYFERADYQASEDAMIWGKYGFAPRFSRLALRHLFLSSSSASGHCAPSSAETDRIPSPPAGCHEETPRSYTMRRKLKTFTTSAGFFDLAVAAPSMKAALEAWGSKNNLFHQGFCEGAG